MELEISQPTWFSAPCSKVRSYFCQVSMWVAFWNIYQFQMSHLIFQKATRYSNEHLTKVRTYFGAWSRKLVLQWYKMNYIPIKQKHFVFGNALRFLSGKPPMHKLDNPWSTQTIHWCFAAMFLDPVNGYDIRLQSPLHCNLA